MNDSHPAPSERPAGLGPLAGSLHRDRGGIWVSDAETELSYSADGNEACFLLEDSSFWFRHRNDCILAAMRRRPPQGTVLDIGGGNGFVTRALLRAGYQAVLLEPGRVGAAHAKHERGLPEVICSTLEGARFPPGSVASGALFDVIEHVEDDRAFIHQLWTVLGPGARLYMTVPAHAALWSRSDDRAGHYRRHDGRSVARLLEGRFQIEYFTYFFGLLLVPLFLLRSVPYRLRPGGGGRKVLESATEHGVGRAWVSTAVAPLLSRERRRIARGQTLRVGTSCLVVARKVGGDGSTRARITLPDGGPRDPRR